LNKEEQAEFYREKLEFLYEKLERQDQEEKEILGV
jgi:hypothetical protein